MRALAFMERDLRRLLRNPATIVAAVLLPLVYLFILGNALQGPIHNLPLGIVVHDQGPEARELVGALTAIERGPSTFRLVAVDDAGTAHQMLRDGELSGFVVVPERFSTDLRRGSIAALGLYVDNVESVASRTLEATVASALPTITRPLARFERATGRPELRVQEIYPRVDYDTSLVPAVIVMAIFMGSLVSGAFTLVMDRFLGVHESYLSTPLRRRDIALGMLGSGTILSMLAGSVVLVVGLVATGGRIQGGLVGVVALFAIMLLTTIGLLAMMMVVLGRATHPRIAGVVNGFLNVILFFPSGALYPVASFPPWLRAISVVNPEMHSIAALKAVFFRQGDLAAAGPHILFLAGFAAAMIALTILTLKRTL